MYWIILLVWFIQIQTEKLRFIVTLFCLCGSFLKASIAITQSFFTFSETRGLKKCPQKKINQNNYCCSCINNLDIHCDLLKNDVPRFEGRFFESNHLILIFSKKTNKWLNFFALNLFKKNSQLLMKFKLMNDAFTLINAVYPLKRRFLKFVGLH